MKSLGDLRKEYDEKKIDKETYINEMFLRHRLLFEYSDFIKNTDIVRVEISDGSVIMTSRKNSVKMICDKYDKRVIPIEIMNFYEFESEELNCIIELIKINHKKPFIFFDVGANIGWYSINISKSIKDVDIHAFEPIQKTYNTLQRNIDLNQLQNKIEVYNFGFSNTQKTLIFYYDPECSGSASSVNITENENIEEIACKVRTIDEFIEEKDFSVDFIKCDVEGAELFVYQGGINTIKRDKPIIFSEMLRKWSLKFNYHPNEIIKLLKDVGYKCYKLKDKKLIELSQIDEKTEETNFFFLHQEKHLIP